MTVASIGPLAAIGAVLSTVEEVLRADCLSFLDRFRFLREGRGAEA